MYTGKVKVMYLSLKWWWYRSHLYKSQD